MKSVKPKIGSYNARIVVTKDGVYIGFLHGLYKIKNGKEWKEVPLSVRKGMLSLLSNIQI